jgi:GNAT superfamily N-acetyltransferase
MHRLEIEVSCPVRASFRVAQLAGMFDVPLGERATERFTVDIPDLERETWRLGLIVGPCGSGKTTIARRLFGPRVYSPGDWPADRAVVDGVGDLSVRRIASLFTSVGFGSPTAWVKPYQVQSGGERFRCDLARALAPLADEPPDTTARPSAATPEQLVVFDEFTSAVDRTAARFGARAVGKAFREGRFHGRFVAVSCHSDLVGWLSPEWRHLPPPAVELAVVRVRPRAWDLFRRHHYLTGDLNPASTCWMARWQNEPAALCAVVPMFRRPAYVRISRLVTLPEFQGVGIGTRLAEAVGRMHAAEGKRVGIATGHPALVAHFRRSPRWRTVRVRKCQPGRGVAFPGAPLRIVASFEFRPEGR